MIEPEDMIELEDNEKVRQLISQIENICSGSDEKSVLLAHTYLLVNMIELSFGCGPVQALDHLIEWLEGQKRTWVDDPLQ
jgi:hypothetical protein